MIYTSAFGPKIEAMLIYRSLLGFSRMTRSKCLVSFDRYCSEQCLEQDSLTKDLVLGWLEESGGSRPWGMFDKALMVRHLGEYLSSIGEEAYILPRGYVTAKTSYSPYILSDTELKLFFNAIDKLPHGIRKESTHGCFSVLFRLLYTCGLRPNEGRELKRTNINFETGEILISGRKRKNDRVVVMSSDMLLLCKDYDSRLVSTKFSNGYFFPAKDGLAYPAHYISTVLKKCWAHANVGMDASILPRLRVYDLRHRFASAILNKWLDEGRNLNAMLPYLSAYMGHSSLSSTAYYIHILPENLLKSPGIDWEALRRLVPEVMKWEE